jgi:hypothetical protein
LQEPDAGQFFKKNVQLGTMTFLHQHI